MLERKKGKYEKAIGYAQAEVRRRFKEKAVRTWNLQTSEGKIPEIGFRPKREYWAPMARNAGMGMYQYFMMQTLTSYYKDMTPPWGMKAWDIKLTVTYPVGDPQTKEISKCITVIIHPIT